MIPIETPNLLLKKYWQLRNRNSKKKPDEKVKVDLKDHNVYKNRNWKAEVNEEYDRG